MKRSDAIERTEEIFEAYNVKKLRVNGTIIFALFKNDMVAFETLLSTAKLVKEVVKLTKERKGKYIKCGCTHCLFAATDLDDIGDLLTENKSTKKEVDHGPVSES